MKEIWKDVVGYEGLYQVSNLGRVKAMPKRGHKEKIMKPSLKKDGYNRILLSKKGKYKTFHQHIRFLRNERRTIMKLYEFVGS